MRLSKTIPYTLNEADTTSSSGASNKPAMNVPARIDEYSKGCREMTLM